MSFDVNIVSDSLQFGNSQEPRGVMQRGVARTERDGIVNVSRSQGSLDS